MDKESFPNVSEICANAMRTPNTLARPSSIPIYPATVYACDSADQADELLEYGDRGYVYQRDGHPNADILAEKCRLLHQAERAIVTSSGMAATALVLLTQCQTGDHLIVSKHAYGKSISLLQNEAARLGILATCVDTTDLEEVANAIEERTRFVFVETVSNPRLRVSDLVGLGKITKSRGTLLVVDNTFATPVHCQPLRHGADYVIESMTKFMNGHGDVTMGLVAGKSEGWQRIAAAVSTWGFRAPPHECWMAMRGLKTLWVRMKQASATAGEVAKSLAANPLVKAVDFPGLPDHPDHELLSQIFNSEPAKLEATPACGPMITFHLDTNRQGVNRFIEKAGEIPFFPSLGDVTTSFSHPVTTSHRKTPAEERQNLGISEGTIRLSIGLESAEWILGVIQKGLVALDL